MSDAPRIVVLISLLALLLLAAAPCSPAHAAGGVGGTVPSGAMRFSLQFDESGFVRLMEGWVDDPTGLWNALAPLQPPTGARGAYGLIGDDHLLGKAPGYGLRTLGGVARRYLHLVKFHYEQPSGWESLGVQAGSFSDAALLSDASLGWAFFDLRPRFEDALKAHLKL